jgi:hypothetical protein
MQSKSNSERNHIICELNDPRAIIGAEETACASQVAEKIGTFGPLAPAQVNRQNYLAGMTNSYYFLRCP